MRAFDVFLNRKNIDTVFYSDTDKITASEVRDSLINHDGYDPNIVVRLTRGDAKKVREWRAGATTIPPNKLRKNPIKPWAVYKRVRPGDGRSNWKFVSAHGNAHDASVRARALWESTGTEHTASPNDGTKYDMKKNPKRRASPAQLRARAKFVKMVRARSKARKNPKRRTRTVNYYDKGKWAGSMKAGSRKTEKRAYGAMTSMLGTGMRKRGITRTKLRRNPTPRGYFIAVQLRPGKIEFIKGLGVNGYDHGPLHQAKSFPTKKAARAYANQVWHKTGKYTVVCWGSITMREIAAALNQ